MSARGIWNMLPYMPGESNPCASFDRLALAEGIGCGWHVLICRVYPNPMTSSNGELQDLANILVGRARAYRMEVSTDS